jgi:hypothetical protein
VQAQNRKSQGYALAVILRVGSRDGRGLVTELAQALDLRFLFFARHALMPRSKESRAVKLREANQRAKLELLGEAALAWHAGQVAFESLLDAARDYAQAVNRERSEKDLRTL